MIGITERGDAGQDFNWIAWTAQGKPAILITKSPQNILPSDIGNSIVHCTITGFGGTVLEPGVERPSVTLEAYRDLIGKYGPDRVVLRVDPVISTTKGLQVAASVISQAQGRVRISFIDAYPHVVSRFKTKDLSLPWTGLHAPLAQREAALKFLQGLTSFPIEICGEPGMACTGCVSALDLQVLGLNAEGSRKGQRPACACLAAKTELLSTRGQCEHGCLYCYWK